MMRAMVDAADSQDRNGGVTFSTSSPKPTAAITL